MNSMFHVMRLAADRLDELRAVLIGEGMPIEDIDADDCAFFESRCNGNTLGYAGLQGSGPHRLLRSVWIKPALRRTGYGAALIEGMEAEARASGCTTLHLLTTTASSFFIHLGYQIADRTSAPGDIAATREFTRLCPASAVYLFKNIEITACR